MGQGERRQTADALARKRKREQDVVSQMIALYCRGNHSGRRARRPGLCPECAELEAYACQRSERCPFMEDKTFCSNCAVHCYRPEMRERIRAVMRYAGPRMLFHHPAMAIRHMIESARERRRIRASR